MGNVCGWSKLSSKLQASYAKNNGGLFIPSRSVINICKEAEYVIRCHEKSLDKMSSSFIVSKVVSTALEKQIGTDNYHNDVLESSEHVKVVIEQIVKCFAKVRLHHIAKQTTLGIVPTSNRSHCTKIPHFNGIWLLNYLQFTKFSVCVVSWML